MRVLMLLIAGCWLGMPLLPAQADLYDLEHSRAFADHLYARQSYRLAATEYERVLFMDPQDQAVQRQLGLAYLRGEQFEMGANRLRQLYPRLDTLPPSLASVYGKLLLMQRDTSGLNALLAHPSLDVAASERAYLALSQSLLQENWAEAVARFEQDQQRFPQLAVAYAGPIAKVRELKRKRPWLATGLSVLVPGLGKVYTNQWKDGLFSFVFVGGLGFAAYRNFSQNGTDSVLGWIYGGLAAGFYGGNIYGSYQSALRYNDLQTHEILDLTYTSLRRNL